MNPTDFTIDDIVAVVLEYHRPDATFRCIKSLSDAGVRHILVWDNSTDAGATRAKLANSLGNDLDLANRVTIVGDDRNLGFSAGVNAAVIHLSNTLKLRYILLINNDATINTGGVTALFEALTNEQRHALAAPRYLGSDESKPAMLYYNKYLGALTGGKHFGSFAFLSGCCLLVDIDKSGMPLLDEIFFMYGEDVALSHSLQNRGYGLAIAESAKVEHVGAASSIVGSPFYEYHVIRGHLLLTSRIANSPLHAAVLWPVRLASLVVRSVLRTVREGSLTPLIALWRALLGLGVGK